MASIADPVTIERAYFDILVRRAKFTDGDFGSLSAALAEQSFKIVSKNEHDNLLLAARQFMALRSNLINGGVAEATVTLLSQDATALVDQQTRGQPTQPPAYEGEDRNTSTDIDAVDITLKNSTLWNPEAHFSPAQQQGDNHYSNGLRADSFNETPEWADANAEERLLEYFNDGHALGSHFNGTFDHSSQLQSSYRPRYPRMCKRTIVLSGVPDNTNLEDVTRVIRGGMLLEVFIRAADHSALVSFLHEDDAVHFYEHSRKYDLYINHKRVFIKWADRHFTLAGHVAGKIAQGATRNMIIRRCGPNHTAASVRDDLEHIHNLVVIKIEFIGGHCYIKTNSVHNAMFARTCMMSRAKYKGSKIEWDLDECEQSFDTAPRNSTPKLQRVAVTQKPAVEIRNRFATLRLDDKDDTSDDRFDTSTDFAAPSTIEISA